MGAKVSGRASVLTAPGLALMLTPWRRAQPYVQPWSAPPCCADKVAAPLLQASLSLAETLSSQVVQSDAHAASAQVWHPWRMPLQQTALHKQISRCHRPARCLAAIPARAP